MPIENGYEQQVWLFLHDYIGRNYDTPRPSLMAEREKEIIEETIGITRNGIDVVLGQSSKNSWRVREEASKWGTSKDEFERADGWQQQTHIRRSTENDQWLCNDPKKNCEA